jgi:hypothetical protein
LDEWEDQVAEWEDVAVATWEDEVTEWEEGLAE